MALRAQIRGYWRESKTAQGLSAAPGEPWKRAVADHLFETLRLRKNLVFATIVLRYMRQGQCSGGGFCAAESYTTRPSTMVSAA